MNKKNIILTKESLGADVNRLKIFQKTKKRMFEEWDLKNNKISSVSAICNGGCCDYPPIPDGL